MTGNRLPEEPWTYPAVERFFQLEDEARIAQEDLERRGAAVTCTRFEGSWSLRATGEPSLLRTLFEERRAELEQMDRGERLGTVLWWRDEKGYGRIAGDDGYVYFVHFSGIVAAPGRFKTLEAGRRVSFRRMGLTAHGRIEVNDVRPLP